MVTRRAFHRASIAALAAGVGRPAWSAYRLKLGIGTFTYHSLTVDQMIDRLHQNGIDEIELSHGQYMLFAHPTAEMFESAKAKFDAAKIQCVSYYTATIKDDEDLDTGVRFAKILGVPNISGDATGDMLRKIDERLSREGLTFGIHNHWFKGGFAYESVDDVLKGLTGRSKTMGSTLDVGQMAACGHDPVDAVQRLAPYLKMVHLKDVEASGAEHNVLFGKGIANIPGVMQELHKINYRGLVAIEYEKEGDVDADVKYQLDYARKLA